MNKPHITIRIFNAIFFSVFCLVTLYPMWDCFVGSFMNLAEYSKTLIKLFPIHPSFDAYKTLISDYTYLFSSVQNSLFVTLIGTPLSIAVTSAAAYALSRKYLYSRKTIMRLILVTMLFNGGIIPTYMAFRTLHLIDSLWVMIIQPLFNSFYLIIMRTYFGTIPESLEESAKLDGANDMLIFARIIFPISMPIIATMILFIAVDRWNDVFNCLVFITDRKKEVMQVLLYRMLTNRADGATGAMGASFIQNVAPQTQRMAAIIVTTLPILIVYPFLQKYFIKGVMIGSIKE